MDDEKNIESNIESFAKDNSETNEEDFQNVVKNGVGEDYVFVTEVRDSSLIESKKNKLVRIALAVILAMSLGLYLFSGKIKNWLFEKIEDDYNLDEETTEMLSGIAQRYDESKIHMLENNIQDEEIQIRKLKI